MIPLWGGENPYSCYCSTISGYLRVGDFVYIAPSASINDDDGSSIHSKMMIQFRSNKTFGQVMNLFNNKYQVHVADEDDLILDINLYLK
jgi:hypothetical protein